jgi:hypothetical protein
MLFVLLFVLVLDLIIFLLILDFFTWFFFVKCFFLISLLNQSISFSQWSFCLAFGPHFYITIFLGDFCQIIIFLISLFDKVGCELRVVVVANRAVLGSWSRWRVWKVDSSDIGIFYPSILCILSFFMFL